MNDSVEMWCDKCKKTTLQVLVSPRISKWEKFLRNVDSVFCAFDLRGFAEDTCQAKDLDYRCSQCGTLNKLHLRGK